MLLNKIHFVLKGYFLTLFNNFLLLLLFICGLYFITVFTFSYNICLLLYFYFFFFIIHFDKHNICLFQDQHSCLQFCFDMYKY